MSTSKIRTIELYVDYYPPALKAQPFIRYEWFGLKDQKKRIRKYVYLEDEE